MERSPSQHASAHGTIQEMLHTPENSETLSKRSLAILREAEKKDDAPPMLLDLAVDSFVPVEPASLRDPQFAVLRAELVVDVHATAAGWIRTVAAPDMLTLRIETCYCNILKTNNGSACGPVIVPVFKTGGRRLSTSPMGSTPIRFRQFFQ